MTGNEFEQYVRLYLNSVYTTALYYLKNSNDAEDVAQNVFLRLYTYTGSFNDDGHLKAWLLRCAINESKNLLHSHWYRFSQPLDAAADVPASENIAEDDEMLHILNKLSRNNRVVLYMYYYEGYSCAEIGEIVGISEKAASARLRRGRQQLKKLIEDGKEQNVYEL